LSHAAFALCAALLVLAAGQPIITDDLWWHLALGRAFAQHGPWLAEDPLLFAPAGVPSPASWLADLALAGVAGSAGFYALRALHAAVVAAILALAWVELRRASASAAIASAAAIAFAGLASYRLVQLRPDLVSIAASLLVYRWILADARIPTWPRIAATAALCALWANLHAGFPLGLLLIGAALAGLVLAQPLRPPDARHTDRARARRLAIALAASAVATLANPAGIRAHLAYLEAGASTPALERIADEWAPFRPFELPSLSHPSPLAWLLAWGLFAAVAWCVARWIASRDVRRRLDPAQIGVALISLALLLSALRFLWLGIFPMLLLARVAGAARSRSRPGMWIAATACVLAAAFVKLGDRIVIREGFLSWTYYQRPYAAGKYYAHAIWLLADSGVRGNLYTDYSLGGFAGYWLAPDLRTLVNGTLNVPRETLDVIGAIALRRGSRPGEDFLALLDRMQIDVFLGVRLPEPPATPTGSLPTTAHLERTPGWITVFRNANSAIYLRDRESHRDDLDRLAAYYATQGIAFDRQRGFDVEAAIREAPEWAIRHGIVPHGFPRLAHEVASGRASPGARDRLAAIWAVLGEYERAVAIDRELLRDQPQATKVRRRLVTSLLRLGLSDEAADAAGDLEPIQEPFAAQTLPLLSRPEAAAIYSGLEPPEPRPAR
jgi:hypothetical protein